MKLVKWEDGNGYLRQSYVMEGDPDSAAPKGLPHEPPDLSEINWDEVQRDLHNALLEQGLTTWQDVQAQQNTLGPMIVSALKKRIIALYRKKY